MRIYLPFIICNISEGEEEMNKKNKVIKRKAYGYRDVEYFKLKIYNLHFSRYSFL